MSSVIVVLYCIETQTARARGGGLGALVKNVNYRFSSLTYFKQNIILIYLRIILLSIWVYRFGTKHPSIHPCGDLLLLLLLSYSTPFSCVFWQ